MVRNRVTVRDRAGARVTAKAGISLRVRVRVRIG
jgi:hypothetical protein